jgi:hypothetical protein
MIKGLNIFEKAKLLRLNLGDHINNEYDMPIMHKVTEDMLDLEHVKPLMIGKANAKRNLSDKILLTYSYDDDLMPYWNDPFKYIPLLQKAMAVTTPDYSLAPKMNINELKHNVFMNRWIGCLWQTYKGIVIPTMGWAKPDTYDITLGAVEIGSIISISTLGAKNNPEDFLMGYNECIKRIKPPLIILYGDWIEGMHGRFLQFKYTDGFDTKNSKIKQLELFKFSNLFEVKRGY